MGDFLRTLARACLLWTLLLCAEDVLAAAEDDILWLRAYETSFPVGLAGELSLMRNGDSWRGAIQGAAAEAMFRMERIGVLSTTHASIEEISSRVLEELGINREMF